jgi:hypothetical protein
MPPACHLVLGEVVGALVVGKLSDKLARNKLLMSHPGAYLVGSGLMVPTHPAGPSATTPVSIEKS